MKIKLKKFLQPIFVLLLNFCLPLLLLVVSKKINIPLEKATQMLNDFSPDSHGDIDANNKITPTYDLHIIIPCYNVEKYVVDCLESVFSQQTKYSYFVTIVNDGSTDNTLQLIQQYVSKLSLEKRQIVRIINQTNKGLAGARNVGLSNIFGKYVMFIDSDDKLLPNAIQKLLTIAYENKNDIVIGGRINIDQYGNFISHDISCLNVFAWGKIFNSEIFRNLKFPEYLFEDAIVSCCIYPKWKNICLIKDNIYQRRIHSESIMANYKINRKTIDVFYLYPYMFRYMLNKNIFRMDILFYFTVFAYKSTCEFNKKIQHAGFSVLSYCTKEIIEKYPEKVLECINYKQKQLLKALIKKDFAKYSLVARYWYYLIF